MTNTVQTQAAPRNTADWAAAYRSPLLAASAVTNNTKVPRPASRVPLMPAPLPPHPKANENTSAAAEPSASADPTNAAKSSQKPSAQAQNDPPENETAGKQAAGKQGEPSNAGQQTTGQQARGQQGEPSNAGQQAKGQQGGPNTPGKQAEGQQGEPSNAGQQTTGQQAKGQQGEPNNAGQPRKPSTLKPLPPKRQGSGTASAQPPQKPKPGASNLGSNSADTRQNGQQSADTRQNGQHPAEAAPPQTFRQKVKQHLKQLVNRAPSHQQAKPKDKTGKQASQTPSKFFRKKPPSTPPRPAAAKNTPQEHCKPPIWKPKPPPPPTLQPTASERNPIYRGMVSKNALLIDQVVEEMENAFEMSRKPRQEGYFASGLFDNKRMVQATLREQVTGVAEEKLFVRRRAPQQRDLEAVLCIDVSSSMMGERIAAAREALTIFMESLQHLQAPYAIVRFDDHADLLKAIDDEGIAEDHLLNFIQSRGGTNAAAALDLAGSVLEERPAERKLIILLTDGESNASTLRATLRNIQARDPQLQIFAIGLGMECQAVVHNYPAGFVVANLEELPKALGHALMKAVQRQG